jgi:hypothetical protein
MWLRDAGMAADDDMIVGLAPEGPQRAELAEDIAAALAANPAAAAPGSVRPRSVPAPARDYSRQVGRRTASLPRDLGDLPGQLDTDSLSQVPDGEHRRWQIIDKKQERRSYRARRHP